MRFTAAIEAYFVDMRREGRIRSDKTEVAYRQVPGMDDWAFEQIQPWLEERKRYPDGPLFCIVEGPTKGGRMSSPWVRTALAKLAAETGCQKRVHPHGFRHSHACSLAREGQPIHVTSRQLGHSTVGTTATYLMGISPTEVIAAVRARQAPQTAALEGIASEPRFGNGSILAADAPSGAASESKERQ